MRAYSWYAVVRQVMFCAMIGRSFSLWAPWLTLVFASMATCTLCITLAGLTTSSNNGGLSVNNVVCGTK